jgi:hypothetical protein
MIMKSGAKPRTIEVAVLEPGKAWARRVIPHNLEALRGVVGGNLKALPGIQGAVVYVNEDGADLDMPPSAAWVQKPGVPVTMLLGPVLVTGPVDHEGLETPITDDIFSRVKLVIRTLPSAGGV